MNPFKVQCETCQASLRVRDSGFIGQVHACPNCGGMVLIAAPRSPEERDDQAARVDSSQTEQVKPLFMGLSDSLIDDDQCADNFSATPAASNQGESATESFAADNQSIAQDRSTVEELEEATPAKMVVATGPLVWLTLGMIAAGGFAIYALLPTGEVVALNGNTTGKVEAVDSLDKPSQDASLSAMVNDASQGATLPESVADQANEEPSPNPSQPQTVKVNKPTVVEDPVTEDPNEDLIGDAFDPLPAEVEPDAEETASKTPESSNSSTNQATSQATAKKPAVRVAMNQQSSPKFDPLDYDPMSIDMVLHPNSSETAKEQPVEQVALLPSNERHSEADQLNVVDPNRLKKRAISVTLIDNGFDPEEEPVSAAERLAMPIPKIDLKKIPLATAIELLSQLSGAPITLEPTSLKQAGIDARRKVNVTGEGMALGDVLAKCLKSVRLAYRTEGSHVVTLRPGVEQSKSTEHQLADLVDANRAVSITNFEALLMQIAPQEVAAQGIEITESGTLTLNVPRSAQYEMILLTERLRLARGLPPQSKYPRRLLTAEPVLAQLATALEHRTTFSFVTPTSLRQIVDHWSQTTGLTILVDWESLSEQGINPHSTFTAAVNQKTWIEALDGILKPLGLTWAPVDRQTIWITSLEREASSQYVEFYPGLNEATANTLSGKHPQAKFAYDEEGRTTIVRGSTAAQRAAYALWLKK